jgi:hypothetical protein
MEANQMDYTILEAEHRLLSERLAVTMENQLEMDSLLTRKLYEREQLIEERDFKIKELEEQLAHEAKMKDAYKNRLKFAMRETESVRTQLGEYMKILAEVKKQKVTFQNEANGYKLYYAHKKNMLMKAEKRMADDREHYEDKIEKLMANYLHRFGAIKKSQIHAPSTDDDDSCADEHFSLKSSNIPSIISDDER